MTRTVPQTSKDAFAKSATVRETQAQQIVRILREHHAGGNGQNYLSGEAAAQALVDIQHQPIIGKRMFALAEALKS